MRLETGVFQPNDDWPGIFIRGDTALMGYLPAVQAAIAHVERNGDFIAAAQLRGLAELLMKCDAINPRTGDSITVTGTQWER